MLTDDVKLNVRVGAAYGSEFTTSVGIMQGDCLSAVLLILCLAKTLSSRPPVEQNIASLVHLKSHVKPQHNHCVTRRAYAEHSGVAP